MNRRELLRSAVSTSVVSALPSLAFAEASGTGREVWVGHLDRMARPVLEALAAGRLRATMPIEAHAAMAATRPLTTHLEAFGRLLSGMAPWLELQAAPEGELHARYLALVHRAMASALDPTSPDRMAFDADRQNLVDAAFLGLAVLRAPRVLNADLDPKVKRWLVAALTRTRALEPSYNNWLLFSACVEAALSALGAPWDAMRVDFALRKHMDWYVGDGTYGDGLEFHWDYYNSFVIHPMLQAILEQVAESRSEWKAIRPKVRERATRFAQVQERMIAVDGTYPVVGRSICYRCGAFHGLADAALRQALPRELPPAQVRCALAAVIARTLSPPGTFDANGWLRIGLAGHQPALGEPYISTGSLYLAANAFLPLGLPAAHPFWSAPDVPWTARRVWAGEDVPADHAFHSDPK